MPWTASGRIKTGVKSKEELKAPLTSAAGLKHQARHLRHRRFDVRGCAHTYEMLAQHLKANLNTLK